MTEISRATADYLLNTFQDEMAATRMVRQLLMDHDWTLGDLYARVSLTHPTLRPADIRDILNVGIQYGLIEEPSGGVYHWKPPAERSGVERWENWLRELEQPRQVHDTHKVTADKLGITLATAKEAIAELQARVAELEGSREA